MARYLHIGFGPKTLTKDQRDALEGVFNDAPDWLRYAGNAWILWTSQTPQDWTETIKALPNSSDLPGFVIVPIHAEEKWGSATKMIWDWFNKER